MTTRALTVVALSVLNWIVWAGPASGVEAALGRQVETIVSTAGFQGGLVVHVGCGDGRLTAALGADGRAVVLRPMDRSRARR